MQKSLVSQLGHFIKNQSVDHDISAKSTFFKILLTIRTTLLTEPFALLGAAISGLLSGILVGLVGVAESSKESSLTSPDINLVIAGLFLAIIFAPVIEELVFRSWIHLRLRYLFLIPGYLMTKVIFSFLGSNDSFLEFYDSLPRILSFSFDSIIVPAVSLIVFYLIGRSLESTNFGKKVYEIGRQKVRFLVILSTLAFAWIHGGNIFQNSFWYLAPFITLSQLISGYFFAFIRLKIGLVYSMISHSIANSVFSVPAFFFGLMSQSPLVADQTAELENLSAGDVIPVLLAGAFLILYVVATIISFVYSAYEHFKFVSKTKSK